MKLTKIPNIKPRNGETHGLFGVKSLKHHNMRDEQWKAEDLVEQYDRVCYIFEKDNDVKILQKERIESQLREKYVMLKKVYKDKIEMLKTLNEGDIQRTKNILLNFPEYLRTYYNKRSNVVLEDLDCKTFLMRKALDRYLSERSRLIKVYEKRLLDVANFQEMICYYDIKEFQQERYTKRLSVELKNSETRIQTAEKINLTYKMIIEQMLHDSLYYLPVLEAINSDWLEQSNLVQQIYNIGFPAIEHTKKSEKEVIRLGNYGKKEEAKRFEELMKNRQILKEHPKKVKMLVRRDSDFSAVGDRYLRDTSSMTSLKKTCGFYEQLMQQLKSATLSKKTSAVVLRAKNMVSTRDEQNDNVANLKKNWGNLNDHSIIVQLVHDMLLDGEVKLYDEKYFEEFAVLQKAINVEKDKQNIHNQLIEERTELYNLTAVSFQHLIDILRHVGTKRIYKNFEYPDNENFKVPFFRFFRNLPNKPKIIQNDTGKLLILLKSKVKRLTQSYKKKKELVEIDFPKAVSTYQKAFVEDSTNNFRPRADSLDFE